MRRIILFSASCLLASAFIMSFIPADCLKQYWGSKTLYTYKDSKKVDMPVGYYPAFVNYVGRHGARHVVNLKDALFLMQLLSNAEQKKSLTTDGRILKKMVNIFLKIENKENCGLISGEGEDELYGIGKRMAANYPSLFNNKNNYYVVATTKEQRTRQSAACFMNGLGHPIGTDTNVRLNDNDSIHLRFFELAAAYRKFVKKGSWIAQMEQIRNTAHAKMMNKEICGRFFTNDYLSLLLNDQLKDSLISGTTIAYKTEKVTDAIFSVASGANALKKEIITAGYRLSDLNFRSLLTCKEFEWLEFVSSARDFLVKGPGLDINGIQVRNALPLLVDFIHATDSAVKSDAYAANIRFAHAETIAPFAALAEVEGAATAVADIFSYNEFWQASYVMRYSANMQWIIYKNNDPGKDLLIKILYNEDPVHIPVHTDIYPYYKWADVKRYYIQKLERYHVSLNEDMYQYLLNLK